MFVLDRKSNNRINAMVTDTQPLEGQLFRMLRIYAELLNLS